MSRQTLERWRRWWRETFPASRFWRSLRGRFVPAVGDDLPLAMLERFIHGEHPVVALLQLLQPISTAPWLEASAS